MRMHMVPLSVVRCRPAEVIVHDFPKEVMRGAYVGWLVENVNRKKI